MAKQKQGKASRKHGRNKKWCEAYSLREQREVNKAPRLIRHLRRHPGDNVAYHCYTNLSIRARKAFPLPVDFERGLAT